MWNELAIDVHAQNVQAGWWDEYLPDNKSARFEGAMMLTVSELAEAMEGHRKNLMDDHLPAELMFDVELADTAIRLLDMAGAYKVDLDNDQKPRPNLFVGLKPEDIPDKLYRIVGKLTHGSRSDVIYNGFHAVVRLADETNVQLLRLIALKRAYNRTRADHKRENRAKEGGKKF